MPFTESVAMLDGSIYQVKGLLAKGDSNWKIAKSDKSGLGYVTKSLSLAPASASGFNVCPEASTGCINSCIFTSGFAAIHPRQIQPARIAKTRFLRLNPKGFRDRLEKELDNSLKTANRRGVKLAIRLNVFSDIQWEKECPGLYENFSSIQFYDYTKIYKRMLRYVKGELPGNLHLTFSWSGKNKDKCIDILSKGRNVAVPFHTRKNVELPQTFLDRPVINGDETDLRFLDPQSGYIIGLKAKGKGRKDFESGFVVKVEA